MVSKDKKRVSITLPHKVVGMFEIVRQGYVKEKKVYLTKSEVAELMIKEKFAEQKMGVDESEEHEN